MEEAVSMSRVCPYCQSARVDRTEEGGVLRCRECGRSSLGESIDETGEAPTGSQNPLAASLTKNRRDLRGAPAEIASWPAALFGFAATGLFYGLLYMLPASGFSSLFTDRGWVPIQALFQPQSTV